MPNSIDFYKEIFLHVIPIRVIVPRSDVHPSLHPNCHHQTVFAKFNLRIYYPPPYPQEIWHYKQANTELIRLAITD